MIFKVYVLSKCFFLDQRICQNLENFLGESCNDAKQTQPKQSKLVFRTSVFTWISKQNQLAILPRNIWENLKLSGAYFHLSQNILQNRKHLVLQLIIDTVCNVLFGMLALFPHNVLSCSYLFISLAAFDNNVWSEVLHRNWIFESGVQVLDWFFGQQAVWSTIRKSQLQFSRNLLLLKLRDLIYSVPTMARTYQILRLRSPWPIEFSLNTRSQLAENK